jgi:L-ribulose-5-phosphate 3-epimerase
MTASDSPIFGIYEKALKPQPWRQLFDDVASAGYDYMEISLDESDERLSRLSWREEDFVLVRKHAHDSGIRIFSACLSGHRLYPLGSADKATEARAVWIMEQAIWFCERLGVRVMQVAGYDVFYEPRSADTGKRYLENLAKGVEIASKAGVMLAIEPVEVYIDSVEKAMEIVTQIDSPWLQVYPDVSNLMSLGMDPVEQLAKGQGHIAAVHIRDSLPNFFHNVPVGEGTLDFVSVFRQLKRMKYSGPYLIEMWNQDNPHYLATITDARRKMIEYMEAANV